MRHELKLSLPLAVVVASALFAGRAEGSLVRYDFTGRIFQMTATGPGVPNDEFTGTLIYDDAIPLGESRVNQRREDVRSYTSGTFRPGDPTPDGTGLQLWFDGKAVAPESGGLFGALVSGTRGDGVKWSELVFRSNSPETGGRLNGGLSIAFKVDPSMLASGRFPDGLTVADLPDVSVTIDSVMNGRVYDELSGGFGSSGPVDSFQITPVPEPSWTVAALLAAAAWTVRRRSTRGRAASAHSR